jgi:hypothetical protein
MIMSEKVEEHGGLDKLPQSSAASKESFEDAANTAGTEDDSEVIKYITGIALFSVLGAVTLVIFLMFLDMSIISTV